MPRKLAAERDESSVHPQRSQLVAATMPHALATRRGYRVGGVTSHKIPRWESMKTVNFSEANRKKAGAAKMRAVIEPTMMIHDKEGIVIIQKLAHFSGRDPFTPGEYQRKEQCLLAIGKAAHQGKFNATKARHRLFSNA